MALKKGDMETNFEVRSFDVKITLEEYNKLPKHPLYIVLDNLRSAFNVGAIFRLCDSLRIKELYLCGYTAYPPHDKLEKTSLGTINYVPWKHFDTTIEAVMDLKDRGIPVWGAETTSNAVLYNSVEYPSKLAIVFGNEALGVNRQILEMCDQIIEVPLYGYKNSLNVATSCAVIGFTIVESMKRRS